MKFTILKTAEKAREKLNANYNLQSKKKKNMHIEKDNDKNKCEIY